MSGGSKKKYISSAMCGERPRQGETGVSASDTILHMHLFYGYWLDIKAQDVPCVWRDGVPTEFSKAWAGRVYKRLQPYDQRHEPWEFDLGAGDPHSLIERASDAIRDHLGITKSGYPKKGAA